MKKIVLLFLLILATVCGSAQTTWKKVYPGNVKLGATSIAPDIDGYMVIEAQHTDGVPLIETKKSRMMKVSLEGNIVFQKDWIPNFYAGQILSTPSGYLMLGITYIPTGLSSTIWNLTFLRLIKTDRNGSILWDKIYPIEDSILEVDGFSMELADNGSDNEPVVILVGSDNPITQKQVPYVFCVDIGGSILWQKKYDFGCYRDMPYQGIKRVPGGFVFSVNGYADTPALAEGHINSFRMVKISLTGEVVWNISVSDQILGFSPIRKDHSVLLSTLGGYITLNASGVVVSEHFCTDFPSILIPSSQTDSTIVGIEIYNELLSSGGGAMSFCVKEVNQAGNEEYWQARVRGTLNPDSSYFAKDCIPSIDEGYIICGSIQIADGAHSFVAKVGEHRFSTMIPKISEETVLVYPNPVISTYTIACEGAWSATLYDITGKVVQTISGQGTQSFQKGNLSGFFIVAIQHGKGMETKKLFFE